MSNIAGPVDRGEIVGAGIAGLAAAWRLRQAGMTPPCSKPAIASAAGCTPSISPVRGRTGGSWIHHPIGNPLTAFCDDHGIARDAGTSFRPPSTTARKVSGSGRVGMLPRRCDPVTLDQ